MIERKIVAWCRDDEWWLPANERNDTKATEMYRLYQRGFSLAQVADAFGCSRQSVHDVFRARGWARRSRPHPLPFVMFQGNKYTRRNTGYYGCTNGEKIFTLSSTRTTRIKM